MNFTLLKVTYLMGHESVTITVQVSGGPFAGHLRDLHTTQTALQGLSQPGVPWADAEVMSVASGLLQSIGGVLVS